MPCVAASPAPPTSERLCRRRPFIVTIGRGRRQGCAAPPILTRPAFRCAPLQPRQNRHLHAPLRGRFAVPDPDPARPSGRPRLQTNRRRFTCTFKPHAPRHGSRIWQQSKRRSQHTGCLPLHPGPRASGLASSSRSGKSEQRRGGAAAPLSSCLTLLSAGTQTRPVIRPRRLPDQSSRTSAQRAPVRPPLPKEARARSRMPPEAGACRHLARPRDYRSYAELRGRVSLRRSAIHCRKRRQMSDNRDPGRCRIASSRLDLSFGNFSRPYTVAISQRRRDYADAQRLSIGRFFSRDHGSAPIKREHTQLSVASMLTQGRSNTGPISRFVWKLC